MKERILKCVLILCLYFFNSSCVYLPDSENFVKIEKPSATHQLDLTLMPANDTIKIFNTTQLTFNFNPFGLSLSHAEIYLDSTKYSSIYSSTSSISIDPEYFTSGIHKLIAKFYSTSGSGSIADNIGAEGYKIEKVYTVLIDGTSAKNITPQFSINQDDIFELSWEECTNPNFEAYIILQNYQTIKEIKDRKCTHFADSLYWGGRSTYSIDVRVATKSKITKGPLVQVDEEIPLLNFKEKSIDSLIVYWKRPRIKCNIRMLYGVGQSTYQIRYSSYNTDTFCIIPSTKMGLQYIFQLQCFSYFNNNKYSSNIDQKYYVFGTSMNNSEEFLGYNNLRNIFFTVNNNSLNSYDMKTKNKVNAVQFPESPAIISNIINSNKIAVYTNQKIYVYQDETFSNPLIINLSGINNIGLFQLTENDFIVMKYYYKLLMINLQNNETTIYNIDSSQYPNDSPKISVSYDGKYISIVNVDGCKILKFENNQFILANIDAKKYSSSCANPLNSKEIVYTFTNTKILEVRNITDNTLIKTIELPDYYYAVNFDSKTGLLLMINNEKMLIIDIHTGNIQSGPKRDVISYWLYGNTIFCSNKYYLDLYKWQ